MDTQDFRICTEVAIKPGQLDNFKTLVSEIMPGLEGEVGTREYIAYISDGAMSCLFDQRYEDIHAFVAHLNGEGAKNHNRIMELSDFVRSWIYAEPNEEAKQVIEGFGTADGVVVGGAFLGFTR